MTEPSIRLEGITLHFPKQRNMFGIVSDFFKKKVRRFTALSGINLEINQGEVIGIIGRNGSGKSTLLRVISGIYPPDEGKVHAAGDISLLAGLGTGFSAHQTGRENALLYGSILGHGEAEMRAKLDEIIEFSELAPSSMNRLNIFRRHESALAWQSHQPSIQTYFSLTKCLGWATRISGRNRRRKSWTWFRALVR